MGRVCHEWLGWKVPWLFTVTYNHRHTFHFPQTTWLHKVVTVLFRCPLPPYRQLHRSITTRDCSLADHRTLLCAFCILGANGNFSPKRKIQKDKLNGCTKVQGIVSTADESPLCGQDGTVFSRLPNKNVCSRLILKLMCLLPANPGLFPCGGPFSWSDGEWYLLPVTS